MPSTGGPGGKGHIAEPDCLEADDAAELDEMLDEALRETFPASDPVSLTARLKPGAPPHRGKSREGRQKQTGPKDQDYGRK